MNKVIFNIQQKEDFIRYYPIFKKWWNERNWKETLVHNLSTTGVLIFDKDKPICAGWLYKTDCAMALIGSVISSIDKFKNKKKAICLLFEALEYEAKNLGFQTIFFPVTTNSLAKLAEKEMNYQNTKQKANELIKFI